MKRLLTVLLLFVVGVCPLAAQQAPKKIEAIAARVNADIILKSDIDREIDLMRYEKQQQGIEPAQAAREIEEDSKDILRNLIDKALLVQIAKEAGLSADLDIQRTLEELRVEKKFATMEELEKAIIKDYGDLDEFKNDIRTKFLTQQVIDHEVIGRIIITQEEMRKYYDANQKDFDKPAGARIAEITILVDRRLPDQVATQRKKAEEAMAAIKKGDDFSDVAEKYSETATAQKGGDLGFFAGDLKEQVNETIAKALENLPKGQTTEILEFDDAFTIFKVTDRHNGGILSYDLAQNFIWSAIMNTLAPDKIREYLVKLRHDGFVEVKPGYVDTGAESKTKKSAAVTP